MSRLLSGNTGADPVLCIYLGKAQAMTLSSSVNKSEPMHQNTTVIRLHATQDCFVALQKNSEPDFAPEHFLKGGASEYFMADSGDVVVVKGSGGGTLYISEGA